MKDKFIQIRIDEDSKRAFQYNCKASKKSMSAVLLDYIDASTNQYTLTCISHFEPIMNLEFSPILRTLLINYSIGLDEENACITEGHLMQLYEELITQNKLHLVFEWDGFQNRIRSECS
jgi:hypothetical protein